MLCGFNVLVFPMSSTPKKSYKLKLNAVTCHYRKPCIYRDTPGKEECYNIYSQQEFK